MASPRWWGGDEISAATPFRGGGSVGVAVSGRKLAASLWRFAAISNGGETVRWNCGLSFGRLGFEFCSPTSIPKSAEALTKWDNCNSRAWGDFSHFQTRVKRRTTAHTERVSELERASCMIKKLADDTKRERRNCRRMDIVNRKLLRDTAETKLSARRFILNLEKEKSARVELEQVCENLAEDIKGTKAQIRALRNHRKMIEMGVEEERKMLQLAEVWREEQAQTKMADAKSVLEDKYAEISDRVVDLNAFMNSTGKPKVLRQDFGSGNARGIKNFIFKFPKSDKEFANVKNSQESNENASGTSEISSLSLIVQSKNKGSSGCKLLRAWPRSYYKDACKTVRTDGSSDRSASSTISVVSPQGVSGRRENEVGRNPHVIRAMKGHIEWPRKIPRRTLTSNLLERCAFTSDLLESIASERTGLRNVLKQRS